jgi:hypothetical protein
MGDVLKYRVQELFNIGIFTETFKSPAEKVKVKRSLGMQDDPFREIFAGDESRLAERGRVEDDRGAIAQPARLPEYIGASSVWRNRDGERRRAEEGRGAPGCGP